MTACGGGNSHSTNVGVGSGGGSSGGTSGGTSGGATTLCYALPLAQGLYGQTSYTGDAVNQGSSTPTAAGLAAPLDALAINASGTIGYLADTANNRVLGFNLPQSVGHASASFVLGQPGFGSSIIGTGAINGSPFGLASPSKAWVSDDGRLVVADTGNNRVLIWNVLPTSNVAPDIVLGQTDLNVSNQNRGSNAPTAASLNEPTAAALAGNKLVVVDQNNNRALIWNADVSTLTTGAAANVELGQIDNGSGNGFMTSIPGYYNSNTSLGAFGVQFSRPTDAWTDGHSLVLSDTGNNRVLYWSQVPTVNFTNASGVIGQPSGFTTTNPGLSAQTLNNPIGVVAAGGQLLVGDSGNNRVLVYSNDYATTLRGAAATGVFGQADFTHGVYNDEDQNGQPGDQENGQSSTNAAQDTLHNPAGISVFNGELFVGDSGNNRVLQFDVSDAVDGVPFPCPN